MPQITAKPVKVLMLFLFMKLSACISSGFTYAGFGGAADVSLNGSAEVTQNGLLMLTHDTKEAKGHAFHSSPLQFKDSFNGEVLSFSTFFVFAIISEYQNLSGHGIAFVIAPSEDLPGAIASQYLGLFNKTNDGNPSNRVFAVELDTVQSSEFNDINDNHVGIDINSLVSNVSLPAAYFADEDGRVGNLTLTSGQLMKLWIEYRDLDNQIDVTLYPINMPKPKRPLLSTAINLSSIFLETMYVGFSSSTGSVPTSHYVLGWTFEMNGTAKELDISRLPQLPRGGSQEKTELFRIGLPVILVLLIAIFGASWVVRRRMKFSELLEDWEQEYGPHRFSYKDLFRATKGFREKELLGTGGFGSVYKGVLPKSKVEIAVKRISHNSRQGMREFVAEIVSIGRLRHRNLVQLLGYCRRKGELLLVYDFMPNGSLDRFLFNQPKSTLNWNQRFQIIKGVASGLLYLHEEWEQVVIHRDIKTSNVLLDGELNGRLGDFGLARLYDHGTDPQTTHVMGTIGYLAPELARTGKATRSTDVFAFGIFILEVASGRRPVQIQESENDILLVDRVLACWKRNSILEICDPNLGGDYDVEEMELVLKLGLICSHPMPAMRPRIRQVMQILERDSSLPELPVDSFNGSNLASGFEGFDDLVISYPSSLVNVFAQSSSSAAESSLSQGR